VGGEGDESAFLSACRPNTPARRQGKHLPQAPHVTVMGGWGWEGGTHEQQIFLPEYLQQSVNTPRTRQPHPQHSIFSPSEASRISGSTLPRQSLTPERRRLSMFCACMLASSASACITPLRGRRGSECLEATPFLPCGKPAIARACVDARQQPARQPPLQAGANGASITCRAACRPCRR
jgi:hypothetical protein